VSVPAPGLGPGAQDADAAFRLGAERLAAGSTKNCYRGKGNKIYYTLAAKAKFESRLLLI
jgi:hypothetical protein